MAQQFAPAWGCRRQAGTAPSTSPIPAAQEQGHTHIPASEHEAGQLQGGTGTWKEFAPRFSFLMKLSAITSVYSKVPLPPCCLLFLPAAGGHLESRYPLLLAKSSFSIAPGCLTLQEKPLPGLILG